MANVSLSGDEKSLESILSWYEDQLEALRDLKNKIIDIIIHSKVHIKVNPKFTSFTLDELNEYFLKSEDELEHLTCFSIISSTEAHLKVDYIKRVRRKDKSPIGRIFRDFNKKTGKRISLEEHILDSWKKETKDASFSNFLGLLKYRHWLAHGRYWEPKLGQYYSVDDVSVISEAIFDVINN
jgi:hypothetical protein